MRLRKPQVTTLPQAAAANPLGERALDAGPLFVLPDTFLRSNQGTRQVKRFN